MQLNVVSTSLVFALIRDAYTSAFTPFRFSITSETPMFVRCRSSGFETPRFKPFTMEMINNKNKRRSIISYSFYIIVLVYFRALFYVWNNRSTEIRNRPTATVVCHSVTLPRFINQPTWRKLKFSEKLNPVRGAISTVQLFKWLSDTYMVGGSDRHICVVMFLLRVHKTGLLFSYLQNTLLTADLFTHFYLIYMVKCKYRNE